MLLVFLFLSTLILLTEQQKTEVTGESVDILSALNSLPKECHKNGKTYKQGEEFEIGHLRYKCQDYGVYSMEGCNMKEGMKPLKLGESVVLDNIKYQCLSHGSSVFYRETTCGILGQPDCDKIPLPSGFEEASKKPAQPEGVTKIGNVELPKGWQLIDGGSRKINGTNSKIVTHVFMFNPNQVMSRARRQSGHGIGRVIGVEDMSGGDSGRPMMPAEMMKSATKTKTMEVSHQPKIVAVQTVGATLKTGDKNDHDLVDLNTRNDKKSDTANFKPGTVKGQKSSVNWQGRKVVVNGKEIGAGVGTFSFGNMPTSH